MAKATAVTKTKKTVKRTVKKGVTLSEAINKVNLTVIEEPVKKVDLTKAEKPMNLEKPMTTALMIVPQPIEPVKVEPETIEKTESIIVEPVKVEPEAKKVKRVVQRGEIRHELSASKGGKVQNRLKGTSTGVNKWGHKIGSQAAKIDNLVETGRFTFNEILTMSGARTKGRIYNHFRALKEKGFSVLMDEKVRFTA